MPSSNLNFTTIHASKYLQQLGKHFGHKVPVTFTPMAGEGALPFGDCKMSATDNNLHLTVTGEAKDLRRLEQFVGDHLARFAFRENPTIKWQRAA